MKTALGIFFLSLPLIALWTHAIIEQGFKEGSIIFWSAIFLTVLIVLAIATGIYLITY